MVGEFLTQREWIAVVLWGINRFNWNDVVHGLWWVTLV